MQIEIIKKDSGESVAIVEVQEVKSIIVDKQYKAITNYSKIGGMVEKECLKHLQQEEN